MRCSRVGEVPDPAVKGCRLIIRRGPKPFPKVPMQPNLGQQPQATPEPQPDPATTQGNNPTPQEEPEAQASPTEPTPSQDPNLPHPEIPPAKAMTAPSHTKPPLTPVADSDEETDINYLIDDEAEGCRLETEAARQKTQTAKPAPTTPTQDKHMDQQKRASADTYPGTGNQAPPLPISATPQYDPGHTDRPHSPPGDQGDKQPTHPDATTPAEVPRDKQPPIRLTLTRARRDTGETKMSQEESKNPLRSGPSNPPPQHTPPPIRTYTPTPEVGSRISLLLKLRTELGEYHQCLLTNPILSPPGPRDMSRQVKDAMDTAHLSKTLKRELLGTTFGQTPSLRSAPSKDIPLTIWLTYQAKGSTVPIKQEVRDWISALDTAEVIRKRGEPGVVAVPLNHTAYTEEDTIELHVNTFLYSPSRYQAWIQPRERAIPSLPQNPTAQGTRPPADRSACQSSTGGHVGDMDMKRSDTSSHGSSIATSADPARGILSIAETTGETRKSSPSAQNEPWDTQNNRQPQPARDHQGTLTLSTIKTGRKDPDPHAPPLRKKRAILRRANMTSPLSPPTSSSPHPSTLLLQEMPTPESFILRSGQTPHPPPQKDPPQPSLPLGYDQIFQIGAIAVASAKAKTVDTPSWERDIWVTQQDWKTLIELPDNPPGAQWPSMPPLHLQRVAKSVWAALTVPSTTTSTPVLPRAPPPLQPPLAPRQASDPVASIPVQHTERAMKRYRQRLKMKTKRAKITHDVQVPQIAGQADVKQPPPNRPKQPPHPTPSAAPPATQPGKRKNPQAPIRKVARTAAKPQTQPPTPKAAQSKAPPNPKKGPPPKAVAKSAPTSQPKTNRGAQAPLTSTKQGPPVKRASLTKPRSPVKKDSSDPTSSSSSSEDVGESEGEEDHSEAELAQDEADSTAEGEEDSPKHDGKDQNAEVIQATLQPPPRIITVRRRGIQISQNLTPSDGDHEPQRTTRLHKPSHRQPPGKGRKPLRSKQQQPPRDPHVDIHTERLPQSGSPQHTLHLISNTLTALTPRQGMGTWTPLRVPWLGDPTALAHLHPTLKPGHPGTIHKAIKGIHALLRLVEDQDGSNILSQWHSHITSRSQCYACGGSTSSERVDPIIELHTTQGKPNQDLNSPWNPSCNTGANVKMTASVPAAHDNATTGLPPPRLTIPEKLWVKPDSWGGKGLGTLQCLGLVPQTGSTADHKTRDEPQENLHEQHQRESAKLSIKCHCGNELRERLSTSKKNSGRAYFGCEARPSCGFFLWKSHTLVACTNTCHCGKAAHVWEEKNGTKTLRCNRSREKCLFKMTCPADDKGKTGSNPVKQWYRWLNNLVLLVLLVLIRIVILTFGVIILVPNLKSPSSSARTTAAAVCKQGRSKEKICCPSAGPSASDATGRGRIEIQDMCLGAKEKQVRSLNQHLHKKLGWSLGSECADGGFEVIAQQMNAHRIEGGRHTASSVRAECCRLFDNLPKEQKEHLLKNERHICDEAKYKEQLSLSVAEFRKLLSRCEQGEPHPDAPVLWNADIARLLCERYNLTIHTLTGQIRSVAQGGDTRLGTGKNHIWMLTVLGWSLPVWGGASPMQLIAHGQETRCVSTLVLSASAPARHYVRTQKRSRVQTAVQKILHFTFTDGKRHRNDSIEDFLLCPMVFGRLEFKDTQGRPSMKGKMLAKIFLLFTETNWKDFTWGWNDHFTKQLRIEVNGGVERLRNILDTAYRKRYQATHRAVPHDLNIKVKARGSLGQESTLWSGFSPNGVQTC
eukprot:g42558.t1